MRRDVKMGSSSLSPTSSHITGPVTADFKTSTSSKLADVGHQGFKPAEQTHVIASTVDQSVLQELPQWCADRLQEVCY